MRSHFLPTPGAAACAVASATLMLNGSASAQPLIAADYATNSVYSTGWSAGQNGGYGFGPWSFDGTDQSPPGQYQGISTASPIGTAWTLATYALRSGIANSGRAITEPGGLQPGQTLEAIINNPTGYHFYRGWDICCLNGTNNNPAGVNTAAIRTQVFAYFATDWQISDASPVSTHTFLDLTNTAAAGMKFDLTLTSTNTYSLTLTPLSDPSAAYTQTGPLTTNLPINWVNFRLYWDISTGLNDVADNYEISSMSISLGPVLDIQADGTGTNVVLTWPGWASAYNLESATNLGPQAPWTPVSTSPVLVNGQNVLTNPAAGAQQFFRLQQ